jgi:hypothetical protein
MFNHRFRDGGEGIGLKFDNQVVVAKQNGSIGDMGEGFDRLVHALFGSWLNVDEDVACCHGGQVEAVVLQPHSWDSWVV